MHWKQWDTPPKYFRPADGWECGRLRSGLPCACGPDEQGRCRANQDPKSGEKSAPCKPRRSLWWRRRRLARAGGLFVAGILALILCLGGDKEFLAPGELTSHHAQILSRHTTENRCAACHELEATESVMAFLTKSWSGHAADRQQQSIKCLECHQNALPNAKDFSPHDLPDTTLAELTRAGSGSTRLTSFASVLPKQALEGNDLACSGCHLEHQGRMHDLTKLNSDRCQSCHANRFASFTNGHPEFTNYPAHQDTRISFNHQSHSAKHFASKGKSFDCSSCHVDESQPSAVGPVGRSVSYERACAACHDAPLRSSFSDGILVINLPSFDREKIEAAGLTLGAWPEEASLMTDGTLSPVLRWLLAGTPRGKSLLAKLPADGKVTDLSTTDLESLRLQTEIAAEIRLLVEELAVGGQPALQKRLSASLSPSNSLESGDGSVTNNPANVMNRDNQMISGVSPDVFRAAWLSWFQDKNEPIAEVTFPKSPVAAVGFGTPSPQLDEKQSSQDPLLEQDPLLAETPAEDPLAAESSTSKSSNADPLNADPLAEGSGSATFGSGSPAKPKVIALPDLSPQTHLPHGGWFVDQRRMAIVYVPVGHSDQIVKSWLTAATSNAAEEESHHFKAMLAPKAMGACTECHKIDHSTGYSVAEEYLWHARESDPSLRAFTRFNHVPHLTLPQLNQCTSCHSLQEDGRFESMQLQNCMDCHTKQGAGDSCTQCHNYHIKLRR